MWSGFADIFEVRGSHRAQRGELLGANFQPDRLHFSYRGLDDVWRETVLSFSPTPSSLSPDSVNFALTLGPGEETALAICVSCHVGHASPRPMYTLNSALDTILTEREAWCARFPRVSTNHEGFNAWVNRSLHDLALLHVDMGQGEYVSAGIPWFATLFGRDSLITALETVAFSPDLAAGVLRTLARLQEGDYISERGGRTGRFCEMRHGNGGDG